MARPHAPGSANGKKGDKGPVQGMQVAGIITEAGGATGHAAILRGLLGIPAVSGLSGILRGEDRRPDRPGWPRGSRLLNPGPEVEAAYRKLQREYVALCDSLIENRDTEPLTADGTHRTAGQRQQRRRCGQAGRAGASGVGLYRTEYLFLTHPTVPTEDEQFGGLPGVHRGGAEPNGHHPHA